MGDGLRTDQRVLICASTVPFVSGGAELLVQCLAEAVDGSGYQADVASMPYRWDPPEQIIKSCFLWRLLNLEEVPEGKVDMVVATKFPAYAVQHYNKVAWIIHQHRSIYDLKDTIYDDLAGYDKAKELRDVVQRMDTRFLSECRKVFAISLNVASRLREYSGIESETIYPPPPYDGKYYSDDYGNDVLLVGRLEPLKRVDLAIKAMKFMRRPGATLRIVGKGFLENPLRELAESEGVSGRVSFEGLVTEEKLLELYARAGCVVYVPYDEDYGYATLEAFKSQRPVVVTDDSGGPLEFVRDGENGRVIPAEPQVLGEAIDEILSDRKKARQLGRVGFEAVEGISWNEVIERLIRPFLEG